MAQYSSTSFAELPPRDQYFISFYNALLSLLGNDIYPDSLPLLVTSSLLLLGGAIMNANVFGTIIVIAQSMNKKQEEF
jgi:hypothetical protein